MKEGLRVAKKIILVDAAMPLPKSMPGIGLRIIEATFGRYHNQNFKDFLSGGGLRGLLKQSDRPVNIEQSSLFWQNCRGATMVSEDNS